MTINRAADLLASGESAIVLCTDGRFLSINSNGLGQSGNWVMKPDRHGDRVIIYKVVQRVPREGVIYLANYVGVVPSPEEGRFVVRFEGAEQVGTTNRNWNEFAETGTNPVRYLSKK